MHRPTFLARRNNARNDRNYSIFNLPINVLLNARVANEVGTLASRVHGLERIERPGLAAHRTVLSRLRRRIMYLRLDEYEYGYAMSMSLGASSRMRVRVRVRVHVHVWSRR